MIVGLLLLCLKYSVSLIKLNLVQSVAFQKTEILSQGQVPFRLVVQTLHFQ